MKRIFITLAMALPCTTVLAQAPTATVQTPEQRMLKLINMERQFKGLTLLEWNAELANAAQAHSRKLASHGDLSHQFPGEPELVERVNRTGLRFNALAENVAVAGNPGEAHQALMNSPGHRANILNREYNAVGIAVVWVKDDMYVTEDFARVISPYTVEEFRDAVVTAFNRARQEHRLGPIDSRDDQRLDRTACSGRADPKSVLGRLPGATQATIFTASQPAELPAQVLSAAASPSVKRMSIGVCFRTDASDNMAKFWVIAAFYPGASWQNSTLR